MFEVDNWWTRYWTTRSGNLYFANNEQASLAFTAALCFAHPEDNLIKFKLYVKFKQTNQISHLETLANQSTLNKAHVIEITKACTVTSMKARNSLVVVQCREKSQLEKKT